MFDMVPFGKRRDDAFGVLAKSLNDVFNDDFLHRLRAPRCPSEQIFVRVSRLT